MCPGGHQNSQKGWSASETSTVLKPRALSPSARNTCSSFSLSMSNASEPFGAVDLPLEGVAAAEREPRRLDRPDRALLELDGRLDRVVDLSAREERVNERRHGGDVADEEAREIDHVGAEVAECTRTGCGGVEAPRVERRVVAPVLEVAAAEVADLAELARLDHLAGETNGGDEAVVEGAEVLDPRCGDTLPDLVALVGVAAERLLAEDVLACLGGGDRRLGMKRVRAAVVEQPDRRVADDVPPVRRPALVAVPPCRAGDGFLVPAGDRDEPWHAAAAATSCRRSCGTRSSGPCP